MRKIILPSLAVLAMSCSQTKEIEVSKSLQEPFEAITSIDGQLSIINRNMVAYSLFKGISADSIDWSTQIWETTSKDTLILSESNSLHPYFGVKLNDSVQFVLSNRHLVFDGPINFRDLGGIPTKEGKRTKWGKIFRSDKLSELSDNDLVKIKDLGITTVVDFRTNSEVEEEPDRLPEELGITSFHLAMGDDFGKDQMKEMINQFNGLDSLQIEQKMGELYSQMPMKWPQSYKSYFAELLKPESTPLLFHCTAGKDRTGMASALLLYSLGVDKNTILKEYELSNFYYAAKAKKYMKFFKLYGIDPEVGRSLMFNKAIYLETVFNTMAKEYGSVDNYLADALGVDDLAKEKLKELYLQ